MDTRVWPLEEITGYLGKIADIEGSSRAFATFTLQHGREWQSQSLPSIYHPGVPRACFANVQAILFSKLGKRERLVYVEGYACAGNLSFPFPTAHAWLVDPEGRVIDPTWEDPAESTYFGVPFNADYVLQTIRSARRFMFDARQL
jgi:hypothetical protein